MFGAFAVVEFGKAAFAGFTETVVEINAGLVHGAADHILTDVTRACARVRVQFLTGVFKQTPLARFCRADVVRDKGDDGDQNVCTGITDGKKPFRCVGKACDNK